jgi:hypothetical protein
MRQEFNNANYESITDFLSAVELAPRNKHNVALWEDFLLRERHSSNWYGADCRNGRDVIKVMREGWPEGRERLNQLREQIGDVDLVPQDRKRRPVRAESGDVVDMTAVWAGRLDIAWRTARRRNTVGPVKVELCANMICHGGAHPDVLFWRGAAAAVLVDILEQSGYMTRLVVAFGGTADGKGKCSARVIVKDHGMPFDVTSTSAVVLPGFFRALGHAWIANHCPWQRDNGGISVGEGNVEPGEVFISHQVRDHGTALAFVKDQIAKVNAISQGEAA